MYLKKLRIKAGLTQEAIAKKLGCNPQQIYNFESGTAPVPLKYVSKMAAALKVKKADLLFGFVNDRVARMKKAVR